MPPTALERRVQEAFATGATVDLGAGDPAEGGTWGPERTVRASVIAELLLGEHEPAPGHVPALRLNGARITGTLRLAGGQVGAMLRLSRCHLEDPPHLTDADMSRIAITHCQLPGLEANGLRTEGFLSLSGSTINGSVRLSRASLSGGLRLNHTRVVDHDGWAIFGGGLAVSNGTFARHARITGGVRITGARLGGGIFMEGTVLHAGAGRYALLGDSMEVEDAMECSRGFTAEGEVRLRGAKITGTLSFDQAIVRPKPGGQALKLSRITAEELILSPRDRIEGSVSLTHSTVGVLLGHPDKWPNLMHLNGFVYESLRPYSVPVKDRIAALARHPDGYRPQPYEQLADFYRRFGRDDLARTTLLAKLRARRSSLRPGLRPGGYLLDWTVGYGYRPWRAAGWFALLLIVGTMIFAAERPLPIKPPEELPRFNALVFTLDLLIPIGSFGQRGSWDPAGWTQWAAVALIAAGWILATALIAGITRVLRPT